MYHTPTKSNHRRSITSIQYGTPISTHVKMLVKSDTSPRPPITPILNLYTYRQSLKPQHTQKRQILGWMRPWLEDIFETKL
jgi:hypothetical protein